MSANLQLQKAYVLKVLRGPDKGAAFKLLGRKVRIGRGPDNDIILTDPKCSRLHAIINITESTIIIENLSTNATVEVNGAKSAKAFLNPGSTITMGNTLIRFEEMSALPAKVTGPISLAPRTSTSGLGRQSPKSKLPFYIILSTVIIGGAWLYSQDENKGAGTQILTDADIDQHIDDSKRRQEDLIRQQVVSKKNTGQYQEANAAYLKGLRDYREGYYSRALQSFGAAIAIFPEHELAQHYYNLSKKRHDELVQFTFNEAQRFMEQNKYREAQSSYQNVMILINDPTNKIYQEAKEKFNEVGLIIRSSE